MSAISEDILIDIVNEAIRAHLVHGESSMLYGNNDKGLRILVEEVGEVARAMNEYNLGNITAIERDIQIERELIQVAAMAGTWIRRFRLEKPSV